jgi:hypothetical protein
MWVRRKMTAHDVCYLCGLELVEPIDLDHVSPRQFYAPEVRKTHNPQLRTIPVHAECNKAFQKDEDYFVHTITPLFGKCCGSLSPGRAVWCWREIRS